MTTPRALRLLALSALPCLTIGAQAPADTTRPARVTFGLGGGFAQSPPVDLGYGGQAPIGYAAHALAELRTPLPFLQVRGEALFANWGSARHVGALTASAVAAPAVRWRAVPYALAGGGAYRVPSPYGAYRGWTLGAGVRVPVGRQAFTLESRVHAFDVGEDGARRLTPPASSGFAGVVDRWRYTYTPLLFGVRF